MLGNTSFTAQKRDHAKVDHALGYGLAAKRKEPIGQAACSSIKKWRLLWPNQPPSVNSVGDDRIHRFPERACVFVFWNPQEACSRPMISGHEVHDRSFAMNRADVEAMEFVGAEPGKEPCNRDRSEGRDRQLHAALE